jgi:hypothetical protein
MNYGFVQPIFFWGLTALAIPVIVHLVFKRRSRRIDLGTLRFLKAVLQANSRSRKLKRWLLLAMRLACVALLVAVFARPHLRGVDTQTSRQFLAILIDQSATMDRRGSSGRLIDQAVAETRQILGDAGDATECRVAFFDHTVHPLNVSDGADKATTALLKQLQAPATVSGATNFSAAMAWARDVCVKSKQAQRRVVLLTDMQRSGLDWAETESLPADVEVRIVDLGQPQTSNASISAVKTAGPVTRPGKTTTVIATLANAGPFTLEKVDIALHASRGDRQINLRQSISLAPGSTAAVNFETPEMAEGLWHGYVELEREDDLMFDNKRWFAILVAAPLTTLIVDGQPDEVPQRTASYYLEASLRLAPPGEVAPERQFEPTVLQGNAETRWPDLKGTSMVVLANVPAVSATDAKRLAKWVREGGGLLVFAGEATTAEGMKPLIDAGLGAGFIRGFATSSEAPWRLEKWNSEHPVFDLFGDIQRGDLSRRAFRGITRIEPADDVAVLARFTGGPPAVLERKLDRGCVLWFASGCDGTWSDWPRSRLYLPLNYQLLGYLGGLTEGGPVRNVSIDGQTDGDHTPGVFEAGRHWNVINVSARESETDRCTIEEFINRFGLASGNGVAKPEMSQVRAAGLDVRDDEVWPVVLVVLLALLLAEGFLANRTVS